MSARKPILALTGAHGWVGGCIGRAAHRREWALRGLVRRPEPSALEVGDEAKFVLGEPVDVKLLAGAKALVHAAYDFGPRTWPEIEQINVRGTELLLAAARAAKVERIVFISTMSAFAGAKSLYGRAKLEMEALAREAGALILRPGLVYGAHAGGMYGSLTAQVQRSAWLPLIGGGGQKLYLVHEEDLCDAVLRFCEETTPVPAQPIIAAHIRPWTLREILEEIARGEKKRAKFLPIPAAPVWAALKVAESCGLRLGFRSDSLVSLMNQDSRPDFAGAAAWGLQPRPYATASLLLAGE